MKTLAELFRRLTPGTRLTVDGPFFKEGRDRRPGIRTVHKCTRFYLVVLKPNGDKSSLQWPTKKDIDLLPDGWAVKEDGKVLLRYRFMPATPEETLAY